MGEARRRQLAGNYPERTLMDEATKRMMEQANKNTQPQQTRPKMTIEMLEDGRIQVHGPIENKLLCYGLLELAKDAVREYADKKAWLAMQQPPAGKPVEPLKQHDPLLRPVELRGQASVDPLNIPTNPQAKE
jgi:hypothetical protein